MSECESSEKNKTENQPASSIDQKPSLEKKTQSKPLLDWKPLGTVRDYFAEQIRQDGFR